MSDTILLMTHSLLSKQAWCEKAPKSPHRDYPGKTWRDVANEELDHVLLRKPFIENVACARGNAFEEAVQKCTFQSAGKGSPKFQAVVEAVRGYTFQQFHTKDMRLDENTIIRWYGVCDAETPGVIKDLKATAKYKGQYRNTTQDLLYRWLTGYNDFTYIIAEWAKYPEIKEVYWEVSDPLPSNIDSLLMGYAVGFIEFLKDTHRFNLYRDCYCHNGQGWKTTISRDSVELEKFYKTFWDEYEKRTKTVEF